MTHMRSFDITGVYTHEKFDITGVHIRYDMTAVTRTTKELLKSLITDLELDKKIKLWHNYPIDQLY